MSRAIRPDYRRAYTPRISFADSAIRIETDPQTPRLRAARAEEREARCRTLCGCRRRECKEATPCAV